MTPARLTLALLILSACDAPSKGDVPNTTPVIDSVRLRSDETYAHAGATLTCEVSAFDPDGDPLDTTFTWTIAGTDGGTGPTLVLTPALARTGDAITCTATVTDPDGATATGTASLPYGNATPAVAAPTITPSEGVTSDSTLTCTAQAEDPDGDVPTVRYVWRNQTAGTGLGDTPRLVLTPATAAPDDVIVCTAQATDPEGATASASATVTVSNRAPTLPTLTVTPAAPRSYEDLRCAVTGAADPDGDRVALTYAWTMDGVELGTGTTLAAPFTVGATLTCTATLSDGHAGGTTTRAATVTVVGTTPTVDGVTLGADPAYNDSTLTCTASARDADGDVPALDYAWSNDTRGVSWVGTDTFTLDAGLAAPGDVITCAVTATDAQGMRATDGASLTLQNRAPRAGAVTLAPDPATVSDSLVCTDAGAVDPDGDVVTRTYAWTVDGTPAGTATVLAGAFRRDQTVACTVTAHDGRGATDTSTATLVVSDTAPAITSIALLPASPSSDTPLYAEVATEDADGDPVSLAYRWELEGTVVGTGATLPAGTAARGDVVTLTVTPTDGTREGAASSASITIGNAAPVVGSVTLTPAAVFTDDVLTASARASDADGDALTSTYDWYVDGALVQSGAGDTLDGAAHFDRDATVHVVVTADDGADTTARASAPVVVSNTAPGAPGIALTPTDAVDGDDLTCAVVAAATDADGDPLAYTFRWTVDGVAYAGATDAPTASVVPGSHVTRDQTWTCAVAATDTDATGASATASVTVVSGEPTWTRIWSHALADTPAGSVVLDGGWLDQYIGSAYGRSAWIQPSDWNVVYIPVTRSGTELEAVEVDVYVPAHAGIALYPLGERNGYNGAEDYFGLGASGATGTMSAGYGGWYDGCCASSDMVDVATGLPGFTAGAWHTLRAEYDLATNEVSFLLDGTEVYTTTSIPLATLSDAYVQLRTGTPCCSTAADVAWTNLEVYEGTR
jgi:hypothetical protein